MNWLVFLRERCFPDGTHITLGAAGPCSDADYPAEVEGLFLNEQASLVWDWAGEPDLAELEARIIRGEPISGHPGARRMITMSAHPGAVVVDSVTPLPSGEA